MHNLRAFFAVLAIAGATTASHLTVGLHPGAATIAKTTAFPIPTCPLDDPNACGMGGPNETSAGTVSQR